MSDKLRAAALLAVDALDSDDPTIQLRAALNLRAALAEQTVKESLTVAEPVACIKTNGELMWLKKPSTIYSKPRPLYTTPPRREWVGLTDEEITGIRLKMFDVVATNYEAYRAIETKLKEKNT